MNPPTLSFHVDCDNLWIYEEEYGRPTSELQDEIYVQALPWLLDLFESFGIKATFFVIGRELERSSCQAFCSLAIAKGHRIANHTLNHPVDFGRLNAAQKRHEIEAAHRIIEAKCGQVPLGFRAPGYYLDNNVILSLMDHGYLYDSSVLPGFAVGLMRLYMRLLGGQGAEKSFGRAGYVAASRMPQLIREQSSKGSLIEFPISTFPIARLPIHTTFVYKLGLPYLRAAFAMLRRTYGHHVYLLHAIDSLDYPASGALSRLVVPFQWPCARRQELLREICRMGQQFHPALTEDLAATADVAAWPASWFLSRPL